MNRGLRPLPYVTGMMIPNLFFFLPPKPRNRIQSTFPLQLVVGGREKQMMQHQKLFISDT